MNKPVDFIEFSLNGKTGAAAPGDPEGEVRLVRALAQANQRDEALNLGRRLRE